MELQKQNAAAYTHLAEMVNPSCEQLLGQYL